jgi:hypothetical protein
LLILTKRLGSQKSLSASLSRGTIRIEEKFPDFRRGLETSELIALDSLATSPACFGVYKSAGKLVRLSAGKEPFAAC